MRRHLTSDQTRELLSLLQSRGDLAAIGLEILVRTGMRQSELMGVTPDDILPTGIRVKALKGSRNRVAPISAEFSTRLQGAWIGTYGAAFSRAKTRTDKTRALRKVWDQIMPGVCLHSLRHTFTLRVYEVSGKDIAATQAVMGHESIASTGAYLKHARVEDLSAAIVKAVG